MCLSSPRNRDVLAERHQLALDVGLARPAARAAAARRVRRRVGQPGPTRRRPVDRVTAPAIVAYTCGWSSGRDRSSSPAGSPGRALAARPTRTHVRQRSVAAAWLDRDGGGPQQVREAPRVWHVALEQAATTAVGVPGGCWWTEGGAHQREPGGAANASRGSARPGAARPAARGRAGPGPGWCRPAPPGSRRAGAPADRGPWCGRARLADRQPAPGERVRPPAAQRLGAHPPPATASGQARRSSSSRWPTASSAKITASATASASHAYQATLTSQDSSADEEGQPEHRQPAASAQAAPPAAPRPAAPGQAGASGQIRSAGRRPSGPARRSAPRPAPGQAQAGGGVQARVGPCRAGWVWWTGRPRSAARAPGRAELPLQARRRPGPPTRVPWLAPVTGSGPGGARVPGWCSGPGGHARALTARAAGHRHRSSRLAAGPCLWAHTAACEGNRATGLPPPPSRLARNSRRRRRIARRGNAAGRSLADLRRPGPLVAPWCPSLVLSERSPR